MYVGEGFRSKMYVGEHVWNKYVGIFTNIQKVLRQNTFFAVTNWSKFWECLCYDWMGKKFWIHEKKSGRKSKNRSSPKVRTGSTPNAAPDANIHPSPPKIKSAPPSNPSLIKSITLRYGDEDKMLLDRKNTESPPVSTRIATPEPKKPPGDDRIDKPPSQQQPTQNNIPNETENVPNENLSELKSTNPSSKDSIPTLPEDNNHSRKRKLPTANPTDTQSESVSQIFIKRPLSA